MTNGMTNDQAHLARITIYPVKSLDGVQIDCARVLANGALEHDRAFAIRDGEGRLVNGKRTPAVHHVRPSFDLRGRTVSFNMSSDGPGTAPVSFHVDADRAALERWLATRLGLDGPARLDENRSGGLPDDTDSPGPTVVSTATLATVAGWFPGLSLDDVRRRFRANLEIGGVEPFWEDRLVGEQPVLFEIGVARFAGTNACQRCVVPSRDALTGDVTTNFAATFAARREEILPAWATRSRYDHFYRLAVNTSLASLRGDGLLRVGDDVRLS
jgi:uncharacterized protein YcbX